MFRKTVIATLLSFAATSAGAALTNNGDLGFTAFNADEDGWSLVSFVDIAPGTSVFFTDNEWNGGAIGSGSFNTGEGSHTWFTGPGTIAAGTVIRFSAVDQPTRAASVGTLSSSGDTGLNATAETIYAYLGAPGAPTTFLSAVSTEPAPVIGGTGLAFGATAVQLTSSADFAEYTGARSGQTTFDGYKALVNDAANWNIVVGGDNGAIVPNGANFTIAPIPEPETYAMMLAGLGLVGWAARRRKFQGSPE